MSWFNLSPEQQVAKDGLSLHFRHRGEGSARTLDRLAEQRDEEGLDEQADELREEADEARHRSDDAEEAPAAKSKTTYVFGNVDGNESLTVIHH